MHLRHVLCFIVALWTCIHSATIGDGKSSLLTGNAIDPLTAEGRCQVENEWYAPETLIPRVHPCHYCLCYAGKVDCYWKSCGKAPENCQILSSDEACNPSLYVCSIPEQARITVPAPVPKSTPARQTSFAFNDKLISEIPKPKFMKARVQTSAPKLNSPARVPLPAVYLQAPALPILVEEAPLVISEPGFLEFGQRLRKRQRGRLFRRSALERTEQRGLRLPIDEEFPVKFDAEFVANLERDIRHKRAINANSSFGLNGDHAHDQEHTIDKGCNILGVRYELGEVIGVATDVCQECRCAAQSLYCSPKCCFQPSTFHLTPALMARGNELPHAVLTGTRGEITAPVPRHPLHSVWFSV